MGKQKSEARNQKQIRKLDSPSQFRISNFRFVSSFEFRAYSDFRSTMMQIRNQKLEIRNKFEIRNSKLARKFRFSDLEISNLSRFSNFRFLAWRRI